MPNVPIKVQVGCTKSKLGLGELYMYSMREVLEEGSKANDD